MKVVSVPFGLWLTIALLVSSSALAQNDVPAPPKSGAPETAAVSEEASQDNSATVAGSGQNGGALDLGLIALLLSGIWIRRKAA